MHKKTPHPCGHGDGYWWPTRPSKHIQQHFFLLVMQLWPLWAVRPLRVGLHSGQRPRAHKEKKMTRQRPSLWNEKAHDGTNATFHDLIIPGPRLAACTRKIVA